LKNLFTYLQSLQHQIDCSITKTIKITHKKHNFNVLCLPLYFKLSCSHHYLQGVLDVICEYLIENIYSTNKHTNSNTQQRVYLNIAFVFPFYNKIDNINNINEEFSLDTRLIKAINLYKRKLIQLAVILDAQTHSILTQQLSIILDKLYLFAPPYAQGIHPINIDTDVYSIEILCAITKCSYTPEGRLEDMASLIKLFELANNKSEHKYQQQLFDVISLHQTTDINANIEATLNQIHTKYINILKKILKPYARIIYAFFAQPHKIPETQNITAFKIFQRLYYKKHKKNKPRFHLTSNLNYYCIFEYIPQAWEWKYYQNYYSQRIPKTAIVIGAGIAGASIAYHLAAKNIDVTVIDMHQSATQASGNPTGLIKGMASADHNLGSQLSYAANQYVWSMLHDKFYDKDWWVSDVIEEYYRHAHNIHNIYKIKNYLTKNINQSILYWHKGIRINPPNYVRALLKAYDNIYIIEQQNIDNIKYNAQTCKWQAYAKTETGQQQSIIAQADMLVLCNAWQAQKLLNTLQQDNPQDNHQINLNLHQVHGQISGIPEKLAKYLPQKTLSGSGYVSKDMYTQDVWLGATYEHLTHACDKLMFETQAHNSNIENIQKMCADFFTSLESHLESHLVAYNNSHAFIEQLTKQLKHRKCIRTVRTNHLPYAASIENFTHLYTLSGLSSYGLSWAHICAKAIVAQATQGIQPLSASLHKAITTI
jgi:glycine/D-amino acid oxidase-like deaminating enzyme